MKRTLNRCAWLLLPALFLPSCASHHGGGGAPKPGQGVAEYRRLALGAREAVDGTVLSLNALAQPSTANPHPALSGFDKALHHLEVVSISTRAKAETILSRGAAYFEEWKEHLPPANTDAGKVMADQFTRLHRQFDSVREATQAAREEFKPFLPALRQLRETLETNSHPTTAEASRQELATTTANGRRLSEALGGVLTALDRASAEIQAVKPPPLPR